MPIQNNIPRKNAKYIHGDVFPARLEQHLTIGFEGTSYNSPFTDSATPPLGKQLPTATQRMLPPLVAGVSQGTVIAQQFQTRVSPLTRIKSFSKQPPRRIVRRTGGPSPTSDTPFHPKPVTHIPQRLPATFTTENVNEGSFLQQGTHLTLSQHTHADKPESRWGTIKKGVV